MSPRPCRWARAMSASTARPTTAPARPIRNATATAHCSRSRSGGTTIMMARFQRHGAQRRTSDHLVPAIAVPTHERNSVSRKKQSGISLVEVMIAMLLGHFPARVRRPVLRIFTSIQPCARSDVPHAGNRPHGTRGHGARYSHGRFLGLRQRHHQRGQQPEFGQARVTSTTRPVALPARKAVPAYRTP